ncbi:YbaB/EbfC family nucleoid-associated protein [Thermostaphylospora chromogena]|uniref:Conserved DNA-binding protein YbaB n=1 Tax=Thermostaphylospora chromogena TaxID=35622 RepID=A0A1H1C0L8_9ACTN|nr:YbaB/EbfC family nucleoid-associated protein [Thermostaphylospora chromogena]SDQ57752.1 Conserved DNA-binding protein YbaB [Thermostaphylospora chromogena]
MHGFDPREENLERDIERAAEIEKWLESGQRELEAVVGCGETAGGRVKATVTAYGRVREIVITPRAMRVGSHALAEEILLAIRRAQQDAEQKSRQLVNDALCDMVGDDMAHITTLEKQFGEVLESFEQPDR